MTFTSDTIHDLLLLAEQGYRYGALSDQEVAAIRLVAGMLWRNVEVLDAVLEKLEAEMEQRSKVLN